MKQIVWIFATIITLASCHPDDDRTSLVWESTMDVTFIVPITGLGDNGYNDCAARGVFRFVEQSGASLTLLRPADRTEAQTMYDQWIEEHADTDSALLILGSSEYAECVIRGAECVVRGTGSGILLYEADNTNMPEGISTLQINRYGVSWLAGAMSQDADALILAATPHIHTLETSIAGFMAGHQAYQPKETTTRSCRIEYLADSEQGFAMPDSAYRYIYPMTEAFSTMIFPLLGGSGNGVLRALNDNAFSMPLVVGMDVDQSALCSRLPFSVVMHIDEVLYRLLQQWASGKGIPRSTCLGMRDGATEIVFNPNFAQELSIWENWYAKEGYFVQLYQQYKEEAMRQEDMYEK